jgi:hypothetical protein
VIQEFSREGLGAAAASTPAGNSSLAVRAARGQQVIVAILREAAHLEQPHFTPVVEALADCLVTTGITEAETRQVKKRAMAAGEKVHFEHNANALLDWLPQVADAELDQSVRERGHHLTRAGLLLACANTATVAGVLMTVRALAATTGRAWGAVGVGVLVALGVLGPIRTVTGWIVRHSVGDGPKRTFRPRVFREGAGPAIGLMKGSAKQVGRNRFRRFYIRAIVGYLLGVSVAVLGGVDFSLGLILPAPLVVVTSTLVQLKPLVSWYDGLIWNLLHWPTSDADLKRQLP